MMKRINYYKLILALLISIPLQAVAIWSGPEEVVITTWGEGPEKIGLIEGDTIAYDDFAHSFDISADGKIVIADTVGGEIEVFDSTGTYLYSISSPLEWDGWPYSVVVNGSDCAVVGYVEITHTFLLTNGSLKGIAKNMGGAKYVSRDCSRIYSYAQGQWRIYTPTGQLLSTSTQRPLELGRWRFTCKAPSWARSEKHCVILRYEVEYPDAVYIYQVRKAEKKSDLKDQVRIRDDLIMDNKGEHVYAYSVTYVKPATQSAYRKEERWLKFEAEWEKPEDRGEPPDIDISTLPPGVEPPRGKVIAVYGKAVIGPDGSIYTWMRSETHYKILRWRWVD